MPGRNGMGPEGRGPMTGHGMGQCAGNSAPGYGFYGRGSGFGRTLPNGSGPATQAMPPAVERWNLERETEYLREELARAEARLGELGGAEGESGQAR